MHMTFFLDHLALSLSFTTSLHQTAAPISATLALSITPTTFYQQSYRSDHDNMPLPQHPITSHISTSEHQTSVSPSKTTKIDPSTNQQPDSGNNVDHAASNSSASSLNPTPTTPAPIGEAITHDTYSRVVKLEHRRYEAWFQSKQAELGLRR
jgi:hypothetical protein